MRYRELGSSAIKASVVGLGTWAVGGGTWWGETDDEESVRAINAALDAGVTLIDTAPIYGWGRSERVVGKAIRSRRDEVVLATKCGLWWEDERGEYNFELEGHRVHRCLAPDVIRREIEMSLDRLGTDRIDLYQTHWQEAGESPTPIAETMAELLKLKDEGKIRAIGVSNATPAQMDEYRAAGDLATCQPRYSMLDRKIEEEKVPYCVEHNVGILPYSPLEQGLLAGKIGMDYEFSKGEFRSHLPWLRKANRRRVLDMLEGWRDLTERYDCTVAQLVIAWTAAQPGIASVLCGARKVEHATANAAAGDVELSEEDIARVRADAEALSPPA